MTRLARLTRAAVALALVAGFTVAAQVDARPAVAASGDLESFFTCITSEQRGDVIVLMDESPSLRTADPRDDRVPAAQVLIGGLTDMVERLDAEIDVRLTGFNTNLNADEGSYGGWRRVDAASEGDLVASVAAYRDREGDGTSDTDYWTALTGTTRLFGEKDPGATRCRLLAFFTDGQFFITYEGKNGSTKPIPGVENLPIYNSADRDQVVAAGIADLCRPGGVADALRSSEITIAGIGLGVANAQGVIPDFTLLQRIVENPSSDCGDLPGNGQLFSAANPKDLIWSFDNATAGGATQDGQESHPICGDATGTSCVSRTFPLDPSLSAVSILISSDTAGLNYLLSAPGSDAPITFAAAQQTAGTTAIGDIPVRFRWYADNETLRVTLAYPPSGDGWTGTWTLGAYDPSSTAVGQNWLSQVTFAGDLRAVISGSTDPFDLMLGQDTTIAFDIVNNDGTVIAPADLVGGDFPLTIGLDFSVSSGGETLEGAARLGADTLDAGKIFVPDDFPLGPATLEMNLDVTSATGLVLQPRQTSADVRIVPPVYYPKVLTQTIDFGRLDGEAPRTTTVSVSGPGCVWVDPEATLQVFQPGTDATFSSPHDSQANCLVLGEGETRDLPITLVAGPPAENTPLAGTVALHLAPSGTAGEPIAQAVQFRAVQQLPLDEFWFWVVFAIVLGLSLIVPFLALLILRSLGARFPTTLPDLVHGIVIDVELSASGLDTRGGDLDRTVSLASNWTYLDGDRRRKDLGELTIRASAGFDFSQAGNAVLSLRGAHVTGDPTRARSGPVQLDLSLVDQWAVVVDEHADLSSTYLPGTLVLLVDAGASSQHRLDRLNAARYGVIDHFDDLVPRESSPAQVEVPVVADPYASTTGSAATTFHDPYDRDFPGAGTSDTFDGSGSSPVIRDPYATGDDNLR